MTETTSTTVPFGRRLADAMVARGPLCVGIDPHPGLLSRWGLDVDVAGLERFALTAVEALADRTAVLKPQSAFFEAWGSAGIAVLERVLATGRDAGALMLLDAKRGDIGSTMQAYAAAYLSDRAPLAADALTVSPFLGFGSLGPAVDAALASGRGLFVLCRTSNPEGDAVQLACPPGESEAGMTVARRLAEAAAARNALAFTGADGVVGADADDGPAPMGSIGADADDGPAPMGSIGLVVGATVMRTGVDLAGFNGPMLAPGIGAQGATPADLRRVFGPALARVLPTVSRSVLSAGPTVPGLRAAASRTTDELREAVSAVD